MSLDKILPMDTLADSITEALDKVLGGVKIPDDIKGYIDEAVAKIQDSTINKDSLGEVTVEKVQQVKTEVQQKWPEDQKPDDRDKFLANCDSIIELLNPIENQYISDTSRDTTALGDALSDLPEKGVAAIVKVVSDALGGFMDIVRALYPGMRKINIRFAVQGLNVAIDSGVFTFAQLFVCWSISAHLLLFAMFVTLVMLWVRRSGMLPADCADPRDLDDLDDDSDSRKGSLISRRGGTEPPVDTVEPTKDPMSSSEEDDHRTYEFVSKKQSDGSSPSSSSSDSGDNLGGTPYAF